MGVADGVAVLVEVSRGPRGVGVAREVPLRAAGHAGGPQ